MAGEGRERQDKLGKEKDLFGGILLNWLLCDIKNNRFLPLMKSSSKTLFK